MGVVWALLATGQWFASSDLFVKVSFTVVAVAWVGMGLQQLALSKRRAERGEPEERDVRPSTSRWGPGRPEERWR
jgi:hypothetical protein